MQRSSRLAQTDRGKPDLFTPHCTGRPLCGAWSASDLVDEPGLHARAKRAGFATITNVRPRHRFESRTVM
jgi:hypothetical protein